MVRQFFTGLALALVLASGSAAPAAAVVAIAVPAAQPARAPAVTGARAVAPASPRQSAGLAFGEIAAALAGIAVIGLARAAGRQPHSVTA